MHSGKLVFAQLMDYLPLHTFRRCVQRYPSKYPTKTLSHLDQFLCMAFAQLTYRESLRGIETCLRAHQAKLYHLGIRGNIAKSTLADANEQRDCRIYMDFAMSLIQIARKLYSSDSLAVELEQTVYALDTTTIDLCLSVFPWARFRQTKAAVKMHTLLDLRGNIPTFIHISDGKMHEVNVLDFLIPEAGSFYIMDRGFTDFARWFTMHQAQAFFVTRAKSSLLFRRVYFHSVDKSTGLRCDQTIALTATKASKDYPQHLRRIKFYDAEHDKHLVFLTNNFDLPALTIAQLYRCRWQIELFFKWIKQHLRIKRFYGTTENAVKTQIWIAISVYVLVAIVKKRLNTETSLYTILQILSLTLFEKTNLDQLLKNTEMQMITHHNNNQLNLFN
ncbi:IS4 family transposase [Nitrosomonas ureae]|uniref:IS4 family transposase n=1 Tax=Nitrosomonas ureae TaxID=44577 RepID=A0A2T5IM04_9PROT|nr:IS4 family transposase [Nitrosomonas ureae]PTQ84852.1 IS4 family transposase [Nitrosomonas ureae]